MSHYSLGYFTGRPFYFQILQRIWRRLQIRGLLSRNIDFPLKENHSEWMSRETFHQILNIALLKSWRDQSTKENRKEAMLEAFNTLPRKDLEELSKLLHIDCEMFGYNTRPDFIFKPKDTGRPVFQFFDSIFLVTLESCGVVFLYQWTSKTMFQATFFPIFILLSIYFSDLFILHLLYIIITSYKSMLSRFGGILVTVHIHLMNDLRAIFYLKKHYTGFICETSKLVFRLTLP